MYIWKKAGFGGVLATFQWFKLVFQQECLWPATGFKNHSVVSALSFTIIFSHCQMTSSTIQRSQGFPVKPAGVCSLCFTTVGFFLFFFGAAVEMNGFCSWNGSALRIMRAVSMMTLSFSRSPSVLIWIVSGQCLSAGELVSRAPPALLSPDLTQLFLLVMRGNSTMIKYQITSAGTSEPLRAFHRQLFLTERLFKV